MHLSSIVDILKQRHRPWLDAGTGSSLFAHSGLTTKRDVCVAVIIIASRVCSLSLSLSQRMHISNYSNSDLLKHAHHER